MAKPKSKTTFICPGCLKPKTIPTPDYNRRLKASKKHRVCCSRVCSAILQSWGE